MTALASLPKIHGLNDYDLDKQLGEGGMGKVYLAHHRLTREIVVVKVVHEHLLHETRTLQRFQQEADLMRRFRHPNAVRFIAASEDGAMPPYIVMEFVRGITLDQLMQKHGRLPALRVGKLMAPLCLFLQTAHDNGLLHRDLTPANIMIVNEATPRETVKVMDFGLARRIGFYIPSGQLNNDRSGIDGGTPDYICPEQVQGRQVDQRGDLYSVGVLLYGLLTGHVPFETLTDPYEIMQAQITQPPPQFSHWQIRDVSPAVEAVVMSCLSKSPNERPETARALIEAYEKAIACRLIDEQAFATSAQNAVSSLQDRYKIDPRTVIDQFEATMVEQMAAMKLRGFVDAVGGQVVESEAGVIRVKLPKVTETVAKKSMFDFFGGKAEQQVEWVALDMFMKKKQVGSRSLVDITVVRPIGPGDSMERVRAQKQFCDQISRELRAYLMAGR